MKTQEFKPRPKVDNKTLVLILSMSLGVFAGCSTSSKSQGKGDQVAQLNQKVAALQKQLDDMDVKLATMSDRLRADDTAKKYKKSRRANKKSNGRSGKLSVQTSGKTVAAVKHPASHAGKKTGFDNGEPIQRFRQSQLLFEAQQYPEAILEFSAFLRDFADHPLAGSAQYHIGESYFRQKEYRLAIDEYKRVLISYDRSSFVPDCLLRLAQSERKLNLNEDATRHRQMLFSLFPQSPAARSMNQFLKGIGTVRRPDTKKDIKKTEVETAPMPPMQEGT